MIIFLTVSLVILCFGLVVFFGAPYLPTLKHQKKAALDLLDLKPGQTILEAGSGDGRVLKAAAERGINAIGYELNPLLVLISWLLTFKQRNRVKIIWGNYWNKDWQEADGIFVFLHSEYMEKLDKKMSLINKPIKLVSVIYQMPNRKPVKKKSGVFLYQY